MTTSVKKALACLLVVLGTVLASPAAPAQAHATLLGTDPVEGSVLAQAPDAATFTFNEPVILPEGGVTVYDAAGDVVPATATTQDSDLVVDLPNLDDGTFVVVWNVVSTDAHPIAGSLTFSVGEASVEVLAPSQPAGGTGATWVDSVVHALHYLGLFVALGLSVFLGFLLPAGTRVDVARRRLRMVATIAAAAAVLTGGVLLAQSALPRGSLVAWVLVALGLTTTLAPAWLALRLGARATASMLTSGALVTAAAPSVVGHTRGYGPEALLIAADMLHVLAASVWLGGLVGLVVTLPGLRHRPADAARTVSRFSSVAAALLVALVATGILMAWRILGTWDNLFHTAYGTLLMVKVGLVAFAAAIAGWNRFVLLPRARGVTRTVRIEAVALVGVLAVTGALVNQPPAVTEPLVQGVEPQVASAPAGDHTVLAALAPARVGPATLRVQLQDATGEPVEPSYAPTVSLDTAGLDLGEVALTGEAAGTWTADVVLPRAGRWEVQVSLRLSAFENPVVVLPLTVQAR